MTKTKKKFEAMTAAEKRVAIAKDVLKQLKAKRIIARRSHYLLNERTHDAFRMPTEPVPVEKLLENATCQTCALGGLFVAAVDRFNRLSTKDIAFSIHGYDVKKYLGRFFDSNQLYYIECAFENELNGPEPATLRRIMLNIARNDGTFVPKEVDRSGVLV